MNSLSGPLPGCSEEISQVRVSPEGLTAAEANSKLAGPRSENLSRSIQRQSGELFFNPLSSSSPCPHNGAHPLVHCLSGPIFENLLSDTTVRWWHFVTDTGVQADHDDNNAKS